jgi:hypothetical protein
MAGVLVVRLVALFPRNEIFFCGRGPIIVVIFVPSAWKIVGLGAFGTLLGVYKGIHEIMPSRIGYRQAPFDIFRTLVGKALGPK